MDRILKYLFLVFVCISVSSCKKIYIYKDSELNLSTFEFNTIWNNYLSYDISEYSTKEDLVGYGYTEIHYYDYLCRQIYYYDNKYYINISNLNDIDILKLSDYDKYIYGEQLY